MELWHTGTQSDSQQTLTKGCRYAWRCHLNVYVLTHLRLNAPGHISLNWKLVDITQVTHTSVLQYLDRSKWNRRLIVLQTADLFWHTGHRSTWPSLCAQCSWNLTTLWGEGGGVVVAQGDVITPIKPGSDVCGGHDHPLYLLQPDPRENILNVCVCVWLDVYVGTCGYLILASWEKLCWGRWTLCWLSGMWVFQGAAEGATLQSCSSDSWSSVCLFVGPLYEDCFSVSAPKKRQYLHSAPWCCFSCLCLRFLFTRRAEVHIDCRPGRDLLWPHFKGVPRSVNRHGFCRTVRYMNYLVICMIFMSHW